MSNLPPLHWRGRCIWASVLSVFLLGPTSLSGQSNVDLIVDAPGAAPAGSPQPVNRLELDTGKGLEFEAVVSIALAPGSAPEEGGVQAWNIALSYSGGVLELIEATTSGTRAGELLGQGGSQVVEVRAGEELVLSRVVLPAGRTLDPMRTESVLRCRYRVQGDHARTNFQTGITFIANFAECPGPCYFYNTLTIGGVSNIPPRNVLPLIIVRKVNFDAVLNAVGVHREGAANVLALDSAAEGTTFEVVTSIAPTPGTLAEPNGVGGWSVSIEHDGAVLELLEGTLAGTTAARFRPYFWEVLGQAEPLANNGRIGIVSQVILSSTGRVLNPTQEESVLRCRYRVRAGVGPGAFPTSIRFAGGLREPRSGQIVNNIMAGADIGTRSFANLVDLEVRAAESPTHRIACIPVLLADEMGSEPPIASLRERADWVTNYYLDQSYRSVRIRHEFISESWIVLRDRQGAPMSFDSFQAEDHPHPCCRGAQRERVVAILLEAIDLATRERDFDADRYDGVLVIHSRCGPSVACSSTHEAIVGAQVAAGTWAHEVGHILFGFFDHEATSVWDLMGDGNYDPHPAPVCAYDKVRAGWLRYRPPTPDGMDFVGPEEYGIYPVGVLNRMGFGQGAVLRYRVRGERESYFIFDGRDFSHLTELARGCDEQTLAAPDGGLGVVIYQHTPVEFRCSDDSTTPGALLWVGNASGPRDTPILRVGESIIDRLNDVQFILGQEDDELRLEIRRPPPPDWPQRIIEILSRPLFSFGFSAPPGFDVDLHVYTADGKLHVGMDYDTGEYEVGIPGAVTSGNTPGGGPEWIGVPDHLETYTVVNPGPAAAWAEGYGIGIEEVLVEWRTVRFNSSGNRIDLPMFEFVVELDEPTVLRDGDGDGLPEVAFRRADSNGSGQVDVSDAIYILGFLFLGTETPDCLAAADANGDDTVDLSDAVFTLGWLFLGTSAPPPPFPECISYSLPPLGCRRYVSCP